jgi:hypothetical protein
MEQELQEKVTIKHIISQPGLHCYARLTIPGYPLQIISVALAHPASWKDDPAVDHLVEEIRRTNQSRNLPAAEIDRLYEEHLRQFLNVKAAAERVQREARAARKKRQEEADANQLAADLQAAQVITGTKQSTGSPSDAHQDEETADEESKAQGKRGQSANGTSPAKPTRNHRRSRRMGKKPVGAPPPEPTTGQTNPSNDDDDADAGNYPLPGSGGGGSFGGSSWGRSWGYEGREGRERA